MTNVEIKGMVELQAQVFAECPDYTTLGLRTLDGELIEVFLPTRLMTSEEDRYQLGQTLRFVGGEWHTELGPDGVGEYRRFWPEVEEYA